MAPELKIKITAAAELSALRSLNDSLSKQIVQAKALGKDYQSLEQDLKRVQAAMAAIKPPDASVMKRSWHALKEGLQELPLIGAFSKEFNGNVPAIGLGMLGVEKGFEKGKEFAEGVVHAAEYAHEMHNLSERTGQTVQDTIVLGQAFKNAGMGAEAQGHAVNMLQKALTGVNEEGLPTKEIFDQLGLSAEKLKNMSAMDALEQISKKIAGLETAADRTHAAMELFGRSGGEMLSLLGNATAIDRAKKQVGDLAESLGGSTEELAHFASSWESIDVKKMQFFAGFAAEMAGSLEKGATAIDGMDLSKLGRLAAIYYGGGGAKTEAERKEEENEENDPSAKPKSKGWFPNITEAFGNIGKYFHRENELSLVQDDTKKTDIKNEELEKAMEAKRSRFEEVQRYGHVFDKEDPKVVAAREEAKSRRRLLDVSQKETQEKEGVKALPTAAEQLKEIKKREADAMAWTLDPSRTNADYEAGVKKLNGLTKERMELERKAAEEGKKTSKDDAAVALKREELDLEIKIAEAKASGNDKLKDQLTWQKDYNRTLKSLANPTTGKNAPGDDAAARRLANADASLADQKSDDPLAAAKRIASEARSAIPRSHMATIGGAMGESAAVNQQVQILRQQLTIAQATGKKIEETAANTKRTEEHTKVIAKHKGGFQ